MVAKVEFLFFIYFCILEIWVTTCTDNCQRKFYYEEYVKYFQEKFTASKFLEIGGCIFHKRQPGNRNARK
jgi:hypothetical protein